MRSSSFCKVESSALMGHGGTQRGAVDVHLSPTQRRSPQSSLPHGRPRLGDISNETKRGHFSCNSTCQPQANFSIHFSICRTEFGGLHRHQIPQLWRNPLSWKWGGRKRLPLRESCLLRPSQRRPIFPAQVPARLRSTPSLRPVAFSRKPILLTSSGEDSCRWRRLSKRLWNKKDT